MICELFIVLLMSMLYTLYQVLTKVSDEKIELEIKYNNLKNHLKYVLDNVNKIRKEEKMLERIDEYDMDFVQL